MIACRSYSENSEGLLLAYLVFELNILSDCFQGILVIHLKRKL